MATKPGTLYVIGTPIGNLEDITLRALRLLSEVDLIAAEDTRVTRTLTRRHNIDTPLTSYHGHTGGKRLAQLVRKLQDGSSIALVSDAGMPGFSDPGVKLVAACAEAGVPVVVVPGPTASSAALAASGFPGREHVFLGFLPAKSGERRRALQRIAQQEGALVLYEAPHRLLESLADMHALLGDRRAVCARELTKRFEEMVRGTLSELIAHFTETAPRGEFTVVVEGAPPTVDIDTDDAVSEVAELVEAGLSQSRAIAHVAKRRGLPRNTLYRAVHGREAKE